MMHPYSTVMVPDEAALKARIDSARTQLDFEMEETFERYWEYLSWYSPKWDAGLLRHDAWDEGVQYQDINTTRDNFPICRAVVDIWTSLEAGTPPSSRAEPDIVGLPSPTIDEQAAAADRTVYEVRKTIASRKADLRSSTMRRYRRLDNFRHKNYIATRRKNLYGISWVKVIPDLHNKRPISAVMKNPATIYPFWSNRDPDDIESILVARQESAVLANARYGLGLDIKDGQVQVSDSSPYYRDVARLFDESRTMVWVEEYWWIDRKFDASGREVSSCVCMTIRVCDRIVAYEMYEGWHYVPFVMYRNDDERQSSGWSDIAGAMDINDEINKRMSQQGDVIAMFSQPRFQLLGSVMGTEREMPDPFEMISLSDTERIEQILTRIDVFPTNYHIDQLFDLLSRVTGLPPIVWGLIANAQTSGRALTASWKATETRLSPKLMGDEGALRRWDAISIDYIRIYDWDGAKGLFTNKDGSPFVDFTYDFPPMEPRDFQEVTMNAITKRDAGLIAWQDAIIEVGDDRSSDTMEKVRAEWQDPVLHPDMVQSQKLLEQAELQNEMTRQQMSAPAAPTEPPPPEGAAPGPPAAAAAAGVVPPTLTSGTLMRGGDVSNQLLQQQTLGPVPTAGPPQ